MSFQSWIDATAPIPETQNGTMTKQKLIEALEYNAKFYSAEARGLTSAPRAQALGSAAAFQAAALMAKELELTITADDWDAGCGIKIRGWDD